MQNNNLLKFVLASSQPSHKALFKSLCDADPAQWFFAKEPCDLKELLGRFEPRFIFFTHWNWKVEESIVIQNECVCFHMTDLPYGRGGSPLQNLILAEKKKTKISAFRMTDELDAGPIYFQKELSLDGRAASIYNRASNICKELIGRIIEECPVPTPQIGNPTVFKRRKPEQSQIPYYSSLEQLHDFIRMLDAPGYPLAFIEYGEFRFEFSHSRFSEQHVEASVKIKKKNSCDE